MIAAGPKPQVADEKFDAEDDVFRAKELAFIEATQGRVVEDDDDYFSGDFTGLKSVDVATRVKNRAQRSFAKAESSRIFCEVL